ncbi:MAG: TIM barrel protein [Oscillospiraceae bacterium]|nr:TIM barrel protein [Oscillospiraceae bacterium]
MSISFGPGGNSISFAGRKFPEELPEYLHSFGLNGYEFECGRGVRISEKTYSLTPELKNKHSLTLSLHAPYYISLSSTKEQTRLKSVDYIVESAVAAKRLGAEKIVVHSGSCSKITRGQALWLAKDTLKAASAALKERGLYDDVIICPETMGKVNQLGTLSEVLELCALSERFLPCVDFGHLNARDGGSIKSIDDYAAILDEIENKAGFERLKKIHIHFSKIMYTDGGEKTHLTFEDTVYGPDFEPLIELIAKRGLTPSIVCESQGTQAEDAAEMKTYYNKFLN